jgi:hypothetical protein
MRYALTALAAIAFFFSVGTAQASHEGEHEEEHYGHECEHYVHHHHVHIAMWCCSSVATGEAASSQGASRSTVSLQGCVWIPPWEARSCQAVLATCGEDGFVCRPSKVEPPSGIAHVGHPVRDCTCLP